MYGYGSNDSRYVIQNERIQENPNNQDNRKDRYKGPGAAKGSDFVSQPLAKSQLLRNSLSDISGSVRVSRRNDEQLSFLAHQVAHISYEKAFLIFRLLSDSSRYPLGCGLIGP